MQGFTMTHLQEHLAALQPGEVPDSTGLDRLLAAHWDEFEGSDEGGMQGYKLRPNAAILQAALFESLAGAARAQVVSPELLLKQLVAVNDTDASFDLLLRWEALPLDERGRRWLRRTSRRTACLVQRGAWTEGARAENVRLI